MVITDSHRQSSTVSLPLPGSVNTNTSKAVTVTVTVEEDESKLNKMSVMNWAETVKADVDQFRFPNSIDEVVELVKSNDKIRCAGALHSCAPLIASEGIIVSLTNLNEIICINPKSRMVRCQAGVRIHDLCDALEPYGLAVGTLGTIDWQTISGAVMTGTHGGALTIPSLHDFVRSYTLVKPDGGITKISKETDPTLFSAMAPSMGVFGAVIEVEIEAVPLQILEARMTVVSFDEMIECFEDVMKANKYARVVVYSSINKATIWTANPVECREAAVGRGAKDNYGYTNFRDKDEKAMLEQYLAHCKNNEFDQADQILERVLDSQLLRLGHYCGQYNHVLCKERNNGIPHADIEFNFDFKENREVLQTVKEYCGHTRIPYYNFEIRTSKRDDAMLSCCQGRDAMWIDFQAKADVSKAFFDDIESKLKPIGFRKHWAKGMDNTDPHYVVEQFPRIAEFVNLMKEFDPEGKFRNTQGESWFKVMDDIVMKSEAEGKNVTTSVIQRHLNSHAHDFDEAEDEEKKETS